MPSIERTHALDRRVLPHWRDRRLGTIDRAEVRTWVGVTLNLYGHLFPSLEAHLTDALEGLRRSATGS